MSNTCPKCGAEIEYGLLMCSSQLDSDGAVIMQTDFCKGRADAIAELDAWHTGEPPEGVSRVIVRLKGLDGQYGYDYAWLDCRGDGLWYWSAGDRSGKWCDYWQWREVRP